MEDITKGKFKMKKLLFSILIALGLGANAQTYPSPTKPIQVIFGFSAGGPYDVLMRSMLERLKEKTGATFVPINKASPGQLVAAAQVASAEPDGYTLFYGDSDSVTAMPVMYSRLAYKTSDLIPVAGIARTTSNIILVPSSFPANNLKELIQYAKANPGKVSFGSTGAGFSWHISASEFIQKHNLDVIHVPYKGLTFMYQGAMAGDVTFSFFGPKFGLEAIATGKLKPIAILGPERWPELPNVATAKEQGEPELYFQVNSALFAPAGTPPEIVKKLSDAIAEIQKDPAYVKQDLEKFRFLPYIVNGKEFSKVLDTNRARNKRVLEKLNLTNIDGSTVQ